MSEGHLILCVIAGVLCANVVQRFFDSLPRIIAAVKEGQRRQRQAQQQKIQEWLATDPYDKEYMLPTQKHAGRRPFLP